MKSLKLIINVSVVVLVITLYPQIKKVLNKVSWILKYAELIKSE